MEPLDFDFIDWELLRQQKLWLLTHKHEHADGILNMLDAIQDSAFATGRYSEEEIYGKLEEVD